jgi:hypothetical protein
MPEPAPKLQKLATGMHLLALFAARRQILWLAEDHLLLLSSTGYTERARRFYFADIQSIVYARTNVGAVLSVLWGAMAAMLVILGFWSVSDLGMSGGMTIVALSLFPLAGLVVNLVAGPTCTCVLSTAVHAERVLALNRIPKAERVIGQILPIIDAAQGRMTAEMLGVDQPEADSVEAGRHAAGGSAVRMGPRPDQGAFQPWQDAGRPAPDPSKVDVVEAGSFALEGHAGRVALRHEPGTFHRATYVLCLVYAASYISDIFVSNGFKDLFGVMLFVTLVIFVLVAFRRQSNSDLPATVKNLTPAILGLLAIGFVASSILGGYFIILNPESVLRESGQIIMPRDSVVTQVYLVCGAIAFALAGVMGLMRLARAGKLGSAPEKGFVEPSAVRDDSL